MGKAPAFQFYPADWALDLEEHPLEIEGAWIRIVGRLWRSDTRGEMSKTLAQWSRILRVTEEGTLEILRYIQKEKIGDIPTDLTEPNGYITVINRRMVIGEVSVGKAPAFQTVDEFIEHCVENRKFGLSVLKRTGLYAPFIFGDFKGEIQICAGYYIIKRLTKALKPRTTTEYKTWRKVVFSRDDLRCQTCGSEKNLEAHHIIPVARKPKLATMVSNGITLCRDCHRKIHKK